MRFLYCMNKDNRLLPWYKQKRGRFCHGKKSFIPPQIPNPFVHEIHLTASDKIRMGACALLLLPLRAALFALVLLLAWPVATLACCCPGKSSEPLGRWRR
ncbi:hypothetical protein FKM82_029959 [Ascaphus truei]